MTDIVALDVASWRPALGPDAQDLAIRTLEGGGVLILPQLAFPLAADEQRFLSPSWSDGKAKNISFDGGKLKGARGSAADLAALSRMVARFSGDASALVTTLFPRYAPYVRRARTSFRPQPAVGRAVSWRKDDSRLHVDAFPSRPNQGERILRVFTNVNPVGEPRVWRVGEPFADVAARFLPKLPKQLPGSAAILHALHITKSRRSAYDHTMLHLHDAMKADLDYQKNAPQTRVEFTPGSTWICYSDQTSHAAMSGQHMLEQTLHLPVAGLYDPDSAPLKVLERLTGRALV